jgi:competence CoiA-like predicted nuclease
MGHHPESLEHIQGKFQIAYELNQQFKTEGLQTGKDVFIELEYPLPDIGEHGRQADVMVLFENGHKLAYECQLASITTDQLAKRSGDYQAAGIDVYWYLGGKADSQTNRDWLSRNLGGYGLIDFEYETATFEGIATPKKLQAASAVSRKRRDLVTAHSS